MRLSYLPPLMVYVAAGISGLTGIVGTFYVKERLGLSAEFLAMLGFWMMLPWALKNAAGAFGRSGMALEGAVGLFGSKSDYGELAHYDWIIGAYRSDGRRGLS